MKATRFSLILGIGGATCCAGAADAAFTGLSMSASPPTPIIPGVLGGVPPGFAPPFGSIVTVYRVYADFDNPLDTLTAIYGNGSGPGFTTLSITNDLTTIGDMAGFGFYNNSFGTDEAPNAALAVAEPSILMDTHATIGAVVQPDETSFTSGFPSGLLNGNGVTGVTNASWFTPGPMAQGMGTHVLIGQWTVHAGEHLSGNVGIQYRPAGAAADVQVNNQSFTSIPAPGVIALLGLAGAAGARRRRG